MGLFKAKSEDEGRPKVAFRDRFKAWWEGYELAEPEVEEVPEKPEDPEPFPMLAELPPLEEPIVKLLMAIWGEGNSKPGNEEFFQYLVEPLGINNAMSVLDFSCGLGAGARSIAKAFDMEVTGVEPDKLLAAAGKDMAAKLGIGQKVVISHYNPKAIPLKAGQFDCIICVDRMHTVLSKMDTLKALESALKARGQITVTDIVLGEGVAADDKRLTETLGDGASRSQFWSVASYQKAFKEVRLNLTVSEDIGERYRNLVTAAWDGFAKSDAGKEVSLAHPKLTMTEVEYWQHMLVALNTGLLRIYRFNATKT
jgi:cyclopropane fatty-acyl-phospholipid synthase-like methyltransferase